ncbi:uncharacterized protein LOC111601628 [Drosophila hydei]|uniref:Uncharacterized protein LOC111601628 n=1 Tax=Drosophila hydei TaxID=7224 RepID=A0A6J1M2J3_DROHY|nr:uncharacterized protein LOC111601628 [Drosophila hydei]
MEAFIITLSILTSIFFIVSIIVIIRRQQKAKEGIGYVINEAPAGRIPPGGVATTHGQAVVAPVYYAPPSYQSHGYPTTYVYPTHAVSQIQVQVQGMPAPLNGMPPNYPPMQQRAANEANMANAELNILPASLEKSSPHQTHQGAVETVSQI